MSTIALRLASKVPWKEYDAINGADDVGDAIVELLAAHDAAEAESAYWKLENRIVVQGTVYGAAVPATQILMSSLLDELPLPVRISILDLFFQILAGASLDANRNLVEQCRAKINEGIWLIVKEFVFGARDAARDILERLDTDIDYNSLV